MSHPHSTAPWRRAAAVLASASLLALAGCASTTGNSSASDGDIVDGGTLNIAFSYTKGCIDPAQTGFLEDRILASWLVDSLTSQDPDTGEILPWLASSWTVSDDATSFTFTLEDGVTFSDGETFDADAVKTAFDAIWNLGNVGAQAYGYLTGYTGTTVIDESTVQIDFSAPNAQFLQATSTPALGILSPDSYEKTAEERCAGDYSGSGLYTLDSYTADEGASLSRREDYAWAAGSVENTGAAHIANVELTYVPEYSVIVGDLTSGQIDVAWPRNALTAENQELITAAGGSILERELPGLTSVAVPNVTDGRVLSDLRLRQALVKAIDRTEIANTVYFEGYPTPTSVLSSTTPSFFSDEDAYAYDPDGAKALIEEAGYTLGSDGYYEKDGQRLTIDWLLWADIESDTTLVLIQDQLKEIGIDLEIESLDSASATAAVAAGDFDVAGTALTRAEPNILRDLFDTAVLSPSSVGYYSQSVETATELSALLEESVSETDTTTRSATFEEIQQLFNDQVVAFSVNSRLQTIGVAENVHGIAYAAENYTVLNDAWIDAD